MPNLYIGTNTNQRSGIAGATLRSGYNRRLPNNALNAQMGHNDVTNLTPGATGDDFGAFTACGGIAVRTADQVYLLHSTPAQYLNDQWNNAGNWLHDNQGNITQAVLINFGTNANNDVTDPIWAFFTNNNIPSRRIIRNGNTALRVSADLTGIFVMNQVNYAAPILDEDWNNFVGQNNVNQ
jgi:hypothetical protein